MTELSENRPSIAAAKKNSSEDKEKRVKIECVKCGASTYAFSNTQRLFAGLCRGCFGKDVDRRPKELNDLTGAEWAKFSLSIQKYPDTRTSKQRLHGACFPLSLVKQQILKYTKSKELVLDPFAGIGTTHDACIELKRSCIGLDINPEFCRIARNDFPKKNALEYRLYTADAERIDRYLKPESADFIITSPPYASLLKNINSAFAYKWKEHSTLCSIPNPKPYTNKSEDLGNMNYSEFFDKLDRIMAKLFPLLRTDRYMAWIVKDYRDLKNGTPYVNFHGDIISCATKCGFHLWDIVIYDQTKYRPLVCLGYPSKRYYHNIGHSYIVIFRKGNG